MSQTKKKAGKQAQKPNFTDAKSLAKSLAPKQRPLSKATTAELTAVLATRGLVVSKPSTTANAPDPIQQIDTEKVRTIKSICDDLVIEANWMDDDLHNLARLVTIVTGQNLIFEKVKDQEPKDLKSHLEIILDLFKKNNYFVLSAIKTLERNLG